MLETAGDKGRRDVSRFDKETSIEESDCWLTIMDHQSSMLLFCNTIQVESTPAISKAFLTTLIDNRAFVLLGQQLALKKECIIPSLKVSSPNFPRQINLRRIPESITESLYVLLDFHRLLQ